MKDDGGWDGAVLADLAPEWAKRMIYLPECGSTNDEARKLARREAGHLTVVLTGRQNAGRGRRGQRWCCPPREGLAFSLVVRPSEALVFWSRLALAAGLAVAEALETFGVATGLKWPNDVWVSGRKICGILVEAGDGFAVVGVGVNVNVRHFPASVSDPATSLLLERGELVSREEVLVACLNRLQRQLGRIGEEFPDLLQAWSERCVLTGQLVTLRTGGEFRSGRVAGLSSQGELLLRDEVGIERILQGDEIRLVAPPNGG